MSEANSLTIARQIRFWQYAALVALFFALYKGLRIPNRWSATQAQIDYSHGFVKRGFFGFVLGGPLHLNHYANFALISFLLLALFLAAVVALSVSTFGLRNVAPWELVAVFAGSYGVTMLASTVGYFDIALASLAIVPLLVKDTMLRLAIVLPFSVCAMLVHEIYLLVFVPVVLLPFVLDAFAAATARTRNSAMAAVVVIALVCGGLGVRLAARKPVAQPQVAAMAEHVRSTVDFAPRQDFFDVLGRSTYDNFNIMRWYAHQEHYWMIHADCSFIFGPTLVFLLWTGLNVSRGQALAPWPIVFFLILFCGLSPLLLHVLAWDVARIDALCCLTCFVAVMVCLRNFGAEALKPSFRRRVAAAFLLLASAASGGQQMNRADRIFPDLTGARTTLWQFRHMTLPQIAAMSD